MTRGPVRCAPRRFAVRHLHGNAYGYGWVGSSVPRGDGSVAPVGDVDCRRTGTMSGGRCGWRPRRQDRLVACAARPLAEFRRQPVVGSPVAWVNWAARVPVDGRVDYLNRPQRPLQLLRIGKPGIAGFADVEQSLEGSRAHGRRRSGAVYDDGSSGVHLAADMASRRLSRRRCLCRMQAEVTAAYSPSEIANGARPEVDSGARNLGPVRRGLAQS